MCGGCGVWLIVALKTASADSDKALRKSFMGVVFIESGLGAGQRQDGKRTTAKKMKLEAGPVRSRSEEQLAFRTVPDMDFMVLRIPGQSAPSFSIEADPEKNWSCEEE